MKRVRTKGKGQQGTILIEMAVSISILIIMSTTFAMAFMAQKRLLDISLCEVVVAEIVDGEMEVLMAGEWQAFEEGVHAYHIESNTVEALPPGEFFLTREDTRLRLEWVPEKMGKPGVRVFREGVLP